MRGEEADMRPVEIHGYAIVSDDDKIADERGEVPPSLRNDKEFAAYQRALAESDLVVFARKSHENEPETHGRPRMVVSREAKGLESRAGVWWWNPADIGWPEVLARVLPEGGHVAAPGGQGVFDLFLGIGYDVFHLARARGVKLLGGRAVFSACETGLSAEDVLTQQCLRHAERIEIDPAQHVEMNIWKATRC
jgi:hypothetical protein